MRTRSRSLWSVWIWKRLAYITHTAVSARAFACHTHCAPMFMYLSDQRFVFICFRYGRFFVSRHIRPFFASPSCVDKKYIKICIDHWFQLRWFSGIKIISVFSLIRKFWASRFKKNVCFCCVIKHCCFCFVCSTTKHRCRSYFIAL
jgi:hypothetical protein